MPSRRPSASTMGPPELPRARGACARCRPGSGGRGGPGTERSVADTVPTVTRWPSGMLATANTGAPQLDGAVGPLQGRRVPVSTDSTTRSESTSTPVARLCTARPSAKVTSVVTLARLWALVRTSPSPTTTPQPRPPWRPMRTTEGATRSATRPMADCRSSMAVMAASREGLPASATSNLQVTSQHCSVTVRMATPASGPKSATPSGPGSRGARRRCPGRGGRAHRRPVVACWWSARCCRTPPIRRPARRPRRDRPQHPVQSPRPPRGRRPDRGRALLAAARAARASTDGGRCRPGGRPPDAGPLGCVPPGRAARWRRGGTADPRGCGTALEARWYCPTCGEVVDDVASADVSWI